MGGVGAALQNLSPKPVEADLSLAVSTHRAPSPSLLPPRSMAGEFSCRVYIPSSPKVSSSFWLTMLAPRHAPPNTFPGQTWL